MQGKTVVSDRDPVLIAQIRAMAENVGATRASRRALGDMMRYRITLAGVCRALCQYLDDGGVIDVTRTDTAPGHLGTIVYEMHPEIDAINFYVKVEVLVTAQALYFISFHE